MNTYNHAAVANQREDLQQHHFPEQDRYIDQHALDDHRELDRRQTIEQGFNVGQSYRQDADTHVCPRTAIVAEGGGQRGIYTAGVLDAFHCAGFNPFGIGIGTSAGAQNLLTYFMGLPGFARRAITQLSADPNFLVPYRWLGKTGVLDLDTYFAHIQHNPSYALPRQRLERVSEQRRLVFVATCKADRSTRYLEPDPDTVVDYMKASSAVPFLYKHGVSIGDDILVDGGVSDPIPVRRACELGARRIIVVRTVPRNAPRSGWHHRLTTLRLSGRLPKSASDLLEVHNQAYRDAVQFMHNPPRGVTILQIAPDTPLQSFVFGSRVESMLNDYAIGRNAGDAALERVFHWRQAGHAMKRLRRTLPQPVDVRQLVPRYPLQ